MKKTVLSLILLCASTAYASDWRVLVDDEKRAIRVDMSSISQQGPYRKAWVRWDYQEPKKENPYETFSYRSIKSLDYFSCAEKRSGYAQMIAYSEPIGRGESKTLWSKQISNDSFSEIIPDSYGEVIFNFVCTYPIQKGK